MQKSKIIKKADRKKEKKKGQIIPYLGWRSTQGLLHHAKW